MQELGRLLQEPLQPKYSQRFFAGRPAAALAGSGNVRGEEEGSDIDPQAVSQVIVLLMTIHDCGRLPICVRFTICKLLLIVSSCIKVQ